MGIRFCSLFLVYFVLTFLFRNRCYCSLSSVFLSFPVSHLTLRSVLYVINGLIKTHRWRNEKDTVNDELLALIFFLNSLTTRVNSSLTLPTFPYFNVKRISTRIQLDYSS